MLQRNLLYTGVTRGKRLVVLVGQKKAVAIAVRNGWAGGVGRSWASGFGLAHSPLTTDWHEDRAMVAADFLQEPQVRRWLDGVEPAWTLLTFESLRALRQEPSAGQSAIRIANDLSTDEVAGSAVAHNTLILLQQAIEGGGLPLTATGNLSRAVVAEMRKLIEWPDSNQADAFRFNKVVNEPDFRPLHVVRILAQSVKLVRAQRGKLVATPLGKSMLSEARQGSLPAILFHLTFWHMDLGYFGPALTGAWPQADIGVVLWSLSVTASDWQTSEKLTRLCTIPEPATLTGTWDMSTYAM
jgi:hypothetical protein